VARILNGDCIMHGLFSYSEVCKVRRASNCYKTPQSEIHPIIVYIGTTIETMRHYSIEVGFECCL